MIQADNHRDAALASVELNEEGFFVHPEQWTEAMVPALAARVGLRELSDRHWQVIRFTRHQFLEHGMGPTVRLPGQGLGGLGQGALPVVSPQPVICSSTHRRHPEAVPLPQRRLVECGSGGHVARRGALTSRGVRHSERPPFHDASECSRRDGEDGAARIGSVGAESSLTLWRNRLRASERPQRIFDAVRAVVDQTGILATRHRRVLDSTVLDDAVTRQDTLMQLVAQIRVVRRLIPEARALTLVAHDYEQGGAKPVCAWNDPTDIDRVVTELVTDAQTVLNVVGALPRSETAQEAVGLLALVAGQDVEPGDGEGTWRIAQRTTYDRVVSVHDPESRHVHKTVHNYRDGFKAHIAVEPETGVVTACDLTAGNVGDARAAPKLLVRESAGTEILGDSAYGAGAFREHLATCEHIAVIKPGPLQRAIDGGFTIDDFAIDLDARTVTCPAGFAVPITAGGTARFRQRCAGCPLRQRCTTSVTGRDVKVHPHHALLRAAREQAQTPEFQHVYRQVRPMVERSIAWIVRKGHRRVAYRGIDRNRIWLGHRIAAVNLTVLLNLGLHRGPDGWAVG